MQGKVIQFFSFVEEGPGIEHSGGQLGGMEGGTWITKGSYHRQGRLIFTTSHRLTVSLLSLCALSVSGEPLPISIGLPGDGRHENKGSSWSHGDGIGISLIGPA